MRITSIAFAFLVTLLPLWADNNSEHNIEGISAAIHQANTSPYIHGTMVLNDGMLSIAFVGCPSGRIMTVSSSHIQATLVRNSEMGIFCIAHTDHPPPYSYTAQSTPVVILTSSNRTLTAGPVYIPGDSKRHVLVIDLDNVLDELPHMTPITHESVSDSVYIYANTTNDTLITFTLGNNNFIFESLHKIADKGISTNIHLSVVYDQDCAPADDWAMLDADTSSYQNISNKDSDKFFQKIMHSLVTDKNPQQ